MKTDLWIVANLSSITSTEKIFGSRLWFLTEVYDGRSDAIRSYSKKIRLGIFRSLDAHRYLNLWQCTFTLLDVLVLQ